MISLGRYDLSPPMNGGAMISLLYELGRYELSPYELGRYEPNFHFYFFLTHASTSHVQDMHSYAIVPEASDMLRAHGDLRRRLGCPALREIW